MNDNNDVMISAEGLRKKLGNKQVLDGVDLNFRRGKTTVVFGRSGEGKSVLLKHLMRLMRPDEGRVYIEGVDITEMEGKDLVEVRKKTGMLFQGAALFDSMTINENVGFALYEHSDLPQEDIRQRVREELKRVHLSDTLMDKKPAELSGGMKKRVGLARTIITRPKIILYDEPTTGLDPITADAINDLIIQMQRELDVTSIVVTHDMQSAFKVGDMMALLHRGKIVAEGTNEEFRNPDNPMVEQFIKGTAHGPMTQTESNEVTGGK